MYGIIGSKAQNRKPIGIGFRTTDTYFRSEVKGYSSISGVALSFRNPAQDGMVEDFAG